MVSYTSPLPSSKLVLSVDKTDVFTYLVRTDEAYVTRELAKLFHAGVTQTVHLQSAYLDFMETLLDILRKHLAYRGNVQICSFNAGELERRIREKAEGLSIISLDPLITEGVHSLATSRSFYPGGVREYGQVNRPGAPSLRAQVAAIKLAVGQRAVCLVDDDIFTGGSVVAAIDMLQEAGVRIEKVVAGVQVGTPQMLKARNIPCDPCVQVSLTTQDDILSRVDVGDPRDFLLGLCGLVVELPGGVRGRAPYILPFASPGARLQVKPDDEIAFSLDVLQANKEFYHALEQVGLSITLGQTSAYFRSMLTSLCDIPAITHMTDVIDYIAQQLSGAILSDGRL